MSVIRFGTLFSPRFAGVMSCCAYCVLCDVVLFAIFVGLFIIFVYFCLFTFCSVVCFLFLLLVCSRLLLDLFCLFVLFCFVIFCLFCHLVSRAKGDMPDMSMHAVMVFDCFLFGCFLCFVSSFNGNISKWDVSILQVGHVRYAHLVGSFNGDITNRDVPSVQDM